MTQHVLEWSKKLNQFNVRPVAEMLARNQKFFINENSHDFLVLMVGAADACHTMAENHRYRLIDRADRQCSTATT